MKIEIKGPYTRLVEDATLVQNSGVSYSVEFIFDGAWEGFAKTALFEAGGASIAVVLTEDRCTIPAECLKRAGVRLQVAVAGTKGEERIATGWCVTGMILRKASLGLGQGGGATSPDDAYEQIMAVVGDLGAAGFEGKTLSEVFREIKDSISETATDAEVDSALDAAFGGAGEDPGSSEEPEAPSSTVSDQEVEDVLNDVFG